MLQYLIPNANRNVPEQNSSPMISAIAFFKWTQVDVELKFKVIKFGFRIENGFNMI